MRILATMKRFPGGLMAIPLLLGALLNTIDQMHLPVVQRTIEWLGSKPAKHTDARKEPIPVEIGRLRLLGGGTVAVTTPASEGGAPTVTAVAVDRLASQTAGTIDVDGKPLAIAELKTNPPGSVLVTGAKEPIFELFRIGGFFSALFKDSALPLIALFLFCVGSQMNLRMGGRALKKGVALTAYKFGVGVGIGYLMGAFGGDPFNSLLGLSMVAVIAAMTNENGGMYAALTGQYGNKSDSGALAVLSINDGPFLTMLGMGIIGFGFGPAAFLAVLLPIVIGMVLGNLDEDIRRFLAPAEVLLIPFFAFALGAGMNLADFANFSALAGGLALGIGTVVVIGGLGVVVLRLIGERSTIAAFAGASVAGNAAMTPAAIAAAAAASVRWSPAEVQQMVAIQKTANAQISIAVVTTALLCPLITALWHRWQLRRGIDGRIEPGEAASVAAVPAEEAEPVGARG